MASLPLKPTAVRLAAIVGVGSLLVGQAPFRRPFCQAAVLAGCRRRGPDRRIDPAWRGFSAAGQPGVEV